MSSRVAGGQGVRGGWPDRVLMCRRANLGLADVEVAAVVRPVGVAMVKCLEAHDRWPSSMQRQTPRSGISTAKGAPPMSLPALALARPHLPLPSRTRCGLTMSSPQTSLDSAATHQSLRATHPHFLGKWMPSAWV
ncbi:hypothetical protein D1007_34767 [Hordeum vulgare]|nr:hypothetical protein D1007_34767 [Hordeum vulgare]